MIKYIGICLLALSVFSNNVFSQRKHLSSDKKVMTIFLHQLRKSEQGIRLTGGGITKAPANAFTIYSVIGEDCGVHCNCLYYNEIFAGGWKKPIVLKIEYPVNAIFKMLDDKYLLLQQANSCGGTVQSEYRAATLISLDNNKIRYYPIVYNDPVLKTTQDTINSKSLSFCQTVSDESYYKPLVLSFSPKTQNLNYRYLSELNEFNKTDGTYFYIGTFEYLNGRFILKKEEKITAK